MANKTELTRENMKELIRKYYDSLRFIEGPQDEDKIREFMSPDYHITHLTVPGVIRIEDREGSVKFVCSQTDKFRVKISYLPPVGLMVDEKRKMALGLIQEEFIHPVTGEEVMPKVYRVIFWELCIHDNKVKVKSETIIGTLL